jgi:hypothetical protein
MAGIYNPFSMSIAAAAWLLCPINALVRASIRAAAQQPGVLLR